MGSTATILHADLDAFYASVEQLLDPRLRAKPIAVGGGVVLAASYEARAFGVRSGMPGRRARQLCHDLIFVGGHFDEYQRLGDAAIGVLSDFTPSIERISISCNWSCRLGLLTKDAILAQERAWRDRAQTGPSMRSASVSEDKRNDYGSAMRDARSVPEEFRRLAERELRISPAPAATSVGSAWAVVTQGHSEPSAAAAMKRSSGQTSIPSSVLS